MPKKRAHTAEDDGGIVDENVENFSGEMEEEQEYDDEEAERRRRKKAKKKRKKDREFKIMGQSGQTDAERRVLRGQQRELTARLNDAGGEEDVAELRDQNNDLWGKHVKHTREAVLDSENVGLITSQMGRQAEKLVQVPRYDAARLAQTLRKKGTTGSGSSAQFNWRGLGYQVGVCFNALPSHVSFLYGPLDAEYAPKERKKPERKKRQVEAESEGEEEAPEDVDQAGKKKESDGNELSAVEKHIKVINRTLNNRHQAEREVAEEKAVEYETQLSQEIDDPRVLLKKKKKFIKAHAQVNAVGCLFNPQSFTQTVENVFHFSFLVKQGDAGIRYRGTEEAEELGAEPGPVLQPVNQEVKKDDPTQAIVSLNMKDWRDMCAAYNVEKSDVPHRVDGKVAKKEKKEKKRKSN